MIEKLIDDFNKLYPAYKAESINGSCDIEETEHVTAPTCQFRKLTINHISGWQFPNSIIKDNTSFYSKSHRNNKLKPCHEILTKDCDGIYCVEKDDKIVFYFCELKSSFTSQNIIKAKDQIVGSALKFVGLLGMMNCFDRENIIVKGVIASYKAEIEHSNAILKLGNEKGGKFCKDLLVNETYKMPHQKCMEYWDPLYCMDIDITYIGVPNKQQAFSIDIAAIM